MITKLDKLYLQLSRKKAKYFNPSNNLLMPLGSEKNKLNNFYSPCTYTPKLLNREKNYIFLYLTKLGAERILRFVSQFSRF